MVLRVGMVSLGCAKNQVDAERMLYRIEKAGHKLVADAALSDIVIVNTQLKNLMQHRMHTVYGGGFQVLFVRQTVVGR